MKRASTAALVLAAGRGERLGGPKALLLVDGVPLVRAHVEARSSDVGRVVVVTRTEVAEVISLPNAYVVVRSDPDADGPAGSIAAALEALAGFDAVVVTPVDVLPASSSAVIALVDALVGPRLAARFTRGHPVAMRTELLVERYRHAAPPLRDVLASLGDDRLATLPLHAGASLGDLDHAADVVAATGAPPRFWSHA